MNTNVTAAHVKTQIQFRLSMADCPLSPAEVQRFTAEIMDAAQNAADGLGASQLFNLDEIKAAMGDGGTVVGTEAQAAEMVDMLASTGEERGRMMLEYTRQAGNEALRSLLKALGVEVPCNCGVPTCPGEMQEGCGHYSEVVQLELTASLAESTDDTRS